MNYFDYELLERYLNLFGFDLDQNPSKIEIKSAYRKLIAKNHPDKVSKLDKEIQDVAKKRTQELNEAFKYIEKNYTPKPMSERLQKINEENFDLKQKLNDLEIKLDKIENPEKYRTKFESIDDDPDFDRDEYNKTTLDGVVKIVFTFVILIFIFLLLFLITN